MENWCGYIFGENILLKIVDLFVNINDGVILFDFYFMMKLGGFIICGKLLFSCFVVGLSVLGLSVENKIIVVDEIVLEDFGG